MSYPIFDDPEGYLELRRGKPLLGRIKRWLEHRAIRRCLAKTEGVRTICDVPCGPGRLFPLWAEMGFEIVAADLSDDFVESLQGAASDTGALRTVVKADAFSLSKKVNGVDLVASVRFLYYFDSGERVALMQELARATNRYVLVQYKTSETRKGRRNMTRARARAAEETYGKYFCRDDEIRRDIDQAGLTCLAVVPISNHSDRVFAIAEKANAGGSE